jgi:hypothetical protein
MNWINRIMDYRIGHHPDLCNEINMLPFSGPTGGQFDNQNARNGWHGELALPENGPSPEATDRQQHAHSCLSLGAWDRQVVGRQTK